MAKYAKKVVAQAQAWLGKNEADGSHKEIIDIYNSHKPLARGYKVNWKTDPWCAVFVSAVAVKLGYTDIIPTECSCSKMIELLKGIGAFVEDDAYVPKAGDILFYDWDDKGTGENKNNPDHVGIVENVVGDTINVIEGNYDDSVKRRSIRVNGKHIRGFGVPKYDADIPKKSVTDIAKEVIAGKWGNGEDRKNRLRGAGYDPAEVQKMVNELVSNTPKKPVKKTVSQIADEVIAGKWGVGAYRKKRLTLAGYDYKAVQKEVNRKLR